MRKTLLTTAAGAALVLGAAQAQAADYGAPASDRIWYASIFGGVAFGGEGEFSYDGSSIYELEMKDGFIVGGTVGAHVTDFLRVEGEVSYQSQEVDKVIDDGNDPVDDDLVNGDIDVLYILGNIWLDWTNDSAFTPYAGGGVGVGIIYPDYTFDPDDNDYSKSGTGFAFQVGAGIQWAFTDSLSLDVGYRFKGVTGVTLEDDDNSDIMNGTDLFTHVVQAGLTLDF
jgi:opacity protein-like surface antigen